MSVEFWPHRGTFKKSKEDMKRFDTFFDALSFIVDTSSAVLNKPAFDIEDIYIRHYGYDLRLENECFMVCIGRYYGDDYLKMHKNPMCHGYLYFDDLKSSGNPSTKPISAVDLKTFLVKCFDVPEHKIKIFNNFCHFVNLGENKKSHTATDFGNALRSVRLIRGMTQKELGLAVGFSEKTADIRIAQYEAGQRIPKADLVKKLEVAMNCEFHQKSFVEYII